MYSSLVFFRWTGLWPWRKMASRRGTVRCPPRARRRSTAWEWTTSWNPWTNPSPPSLPPTSTPPCTPPCPHTWPEVPWGVATCPPRTTHRCIAWEAWETTASGSRVGTPSHPPPSPHSPRDSPRPTKSRHLDSTWRRIRVWWAPWREPRRHSIRYRLDNTQNNWLFMEFTK